MTSAEQPTGLASEVDVLAFDSTAWVGRTIDERYRVEQLLGQGGMGAVFLAEHVKLQKKVALKVILPQFAGNGEVAERFAREAMASAKLEHPHVASALDYGTLAEGGAYLVMQLARGPSLRKILDDKVTERGWRYACDVGAQVADALSAAHAAGIVHRDLKPENVMLEPREDGTELVKVLDFGIARVLDDGAATGGVSKLTRVGTIIGTPGYMSPEQALGEPVDARADLYALGVILWETSAGRELWNETEVTALVTKQLTTEPPRLGSLVLDVPPELDALVARLLARDKNDRPERAGEVRDTLKRLAFAATVERMSIASGNSGSFATLAVSNAPVVTPQPSSISVQLTERVSQIGQTLGPALARPPLLWLVLGGGVLFSLMVLATFVMLCSSGSTPPTTVAVVPMPPPVTTIPRGVEPPPTPSDTVAPPSGTTIDEDFATLLGEGGRRQRRTAADRILAQPHESVPAVIWNVAQLEDEGGCDDRRDVVIALGELGDPRALPALERIDRNRRGCGFLGSQDCYRCLRTELRAALTRLRSTSP